MRAVSLSSRTSWVCRRTLTNRVCETSNCSLNYAFLWAPRPRCARERQDHWTTVFSCPARLASAAKRLETWTSSSLLLDLAARIRMLQLLNPFLRRRRLLTRAMRQWLKEHQDSRNPIGRSRGSRRRATSRRVAHGLGEDEAVLGARRREGVLLRLLDALPQYDPFTVDRDAAAVSTH